MRIAVWHNLPSGGGKRALHDHVRGLLSLGHQVESWCPPSADQSFLPLGDLVPERVLPLRRRQRTPLLALPLAPIANMRARIASMEEHCRMVAGQVRTGGFDVLLANSCLEFRVSPIAEYLSDLPTVLYLQEPYRPLYEAMPALPWLAPLKGDRPATPSEVFIRTRALMRRRALGEQAQFERRNAGKYDRILVNSYFSRESVLRAYNLDAKVCYLGVRGERFANVDPADGTYVLGIGAVVWEKNIQLAIRAVAASAHQPILRWVANVAHAGELEQARRLANELRVDLRVEVLASHDRVAQLLRGAQALIYTPRLEPFGFAPLEAALCRVPTVGVTEGGLRETVVHGVTGLLVGSDATALGSALDSVLRDRSLRERLGAAAEERTQNLFSVEAAAERLEAQLTSAAAGR